MVTCSYLSSSAFKISDKMRFNLVLWLPSRCFLAWLLRACLLLVLKERKERAVSSDEDSRRGTKLHRILSRCGSE